MRKLILLTLSLTCIMVSCQKSSDDAINQPSKKINKTTLKLQQFKTTLLTKSETSVSSDSAIWYLEGLLNYELANNDHLFSDINFFHDTVQIIVNNGLINLDDLYTIYNYANSFSTQISNGIPNYSFDIIDIDLLSTGLKNGTQNMAITLSGGLIGTSINYVLFGSTDYWNWGETKGKCGGYSGYLGRDATTELQRKFRNPIAVPGPGYFTSVVGAWAIASEFPDPENPYGHYLMFYRSGYGSNPPEDICISPDELNYYLSKFDYIKSVKSLPGKTYKTVEVYPDYGTGMPGWERLHDYLLYYGVKIENPD